MTSQDSRLKSPFCHFVNWRSTHVFAKVNAGFNKSDTMLRAVFLTAFVLACASALPAGDDCKAVTVQPNFNLTKVCGRLLHDYPGETSHFCQLQFVSAHKWFIHKQVSSMHELLL